MTTALNNTFLTPATNFSMLAMNPGMLSNIRPVNSAMPMSPVIFQQGIRSQAIQGPLQHPIFDRAHEARRVEAEVPVQSVGTGGFNRMAAGATILLGSAMSGCSEFTFDDILIGIFYGIVVVGVGVGAFFWGRVLTGID